MKTQFRLYTIVKGVSGSSGLIYHDGELILISDDSFVLYHYDLSKEKLRKINLNPEIELQEQMEKLEKPDFEAVTVYQNQLYTFGSGSVGKRYFMAELTYPSLELKRLHSLQSAYSEIGRQCNIGEEDFNIEGVFIKDDTTYFFNRGNGPEQKNGIIKVSHFWSKRPIKAEFYPINLPKINGVSFGFTDAVLVGNQIYFIAAAEDTISTFDDGDILGSGVGVISFPELKLVDFKLLTLDYKLEGIALAAKKDDNLLFYLCEDADDGLPETKVFIVTVYHK